MANYKEIVTKAVIGKGKKTFTDSNTIKPSERPSTILGCWVINHNFRGIKENDKIRIAGSYDINIWYSYDSNTMTDVIRETNNYEEIVQVNKTSDVDSEEEVIVRSLKQPTVIQADINDDTIIYTIEKELGIELVGNTKVRIVASDEDDDWENLNEEDNSSNPINEEIDSEVTEEFLN